ncbi:MAG: tetratricopeptide repeat protein [Planctomycetes bacterium]|nr:tetratricopeptide repeat protein [Planctomycetota bacterium]
MKEKQNSMFKFCLDFSVAFLMVVTAGCVQEKVYEPPTDFEQFMQQEFVLTSLIGKDLYTLPVTERLIGNYRMALLNYTDNPNEENTIWLGRRLAYLYRYHEAVEVFSDGLARFPESYRLYRHRGHRYITLREFDKAIVDFETAAALAAGKPVEIEPDGAPNAAGIPLSNTQFNIYYHLGLAYYCNGDFENAVDAYRECLRWSNNNDLMVATVDWLYMTYRRLGRDQMAAELLNRVPENLELIENGSYYKRLMMYKGMTNPGELLDPQSVGADDPGITLATQGYGVANWFYYNGRILRAKEVFEQIVAGESWSAFGYIAAESDLVYLKFDSDERR